MRTVLSAMALSCALPTPATAAPVRFVPFTDEFLAIEIPEAAKRDEIDQFQVSLGSKHASFELTSSTPHVNQRTVDCGSSGASYQVNRPDIFAYSCVMDGIVTYHVEKFGGTYRVGAGNATETVELDMTYPVDQRAFWDPVVTRMSRTLRVQAQKR